MNQQNQANNSILSPDVPLKRKRGRPRKDQSQNPGKTSAYVSRKKDQIQNPGENAPIPPGFERANGNQPHPTAKSNGNNEDSMNMIGQMVTGVIESSFVDGFLISVRIGESETSLRGVVFKPGHYVPISAENDIAPNLQMIRRNEVPFPAQVQKRRGRPHGERQGSYPSNGSPSSNQLARFRPKLPIVVAQSPHSVGSRGTVVPVVLQPVSLPNGASPIPEAPPIASQPAHLAAISKHKHAAPLTQTTHEAVPNKGSQTDSGSATQSFEELVSVAKRMQGSPDSSEARNESGISSTSMLHKDSGLTPEQAEDLSKPLLVKPLQAIRSSLPEQSTPMSHTFPERRTGKMTELLLAVQENLMERQRAESQHENFKSPEN